MRNPDRWVIDANVAAKWYLRDEDLLEQADHVLHAIVAGSIAGPHIIRYELASSLSTAVRSGRISRPYAAASLAHFLRSRVGIQTDPEPVIQHAMAITVDLPIFLLDAVYIALAASLGWDFVTDDRRLRDAVADRFPFVRWLGDIPVS
jgi:predicted nucleic acid-binding protein